MLGLTQDELFPRRLGHLGVLLHDRGDHGARQESELTVDDLGLGVGPYQGPHVEDRAVRGLGNLVGYRRGDWGGGLLGGCGRGCPGGGAVLGGTAPEDVEAEDRHENPYLGDEVVHVGLIGLGKRRSTGRGVAVDKGDPADGLGELDQLRLEVPHVGLGEVHVFGGDDDDVLPEILLGVVAVQSFDDTVALADVGGPNVTSTPSEPLARLTSRFVQLSSPHWDIGVPFVRGLGQLIPGVNGQVA